MEDSFENSGGFAIQAHGHRDMVEAAEFNSYGNRFALGSADGKIKIYDKTREGSWQLCDTWGAHSAEILEVHWLPPTIHPNLIASIAMDGKFKLWVEDPTLPPLSGRRFGARSNRPVFDMRSSQRAPYISFSVKHNPETRHTFLALLDRTAMLTVYENEEPESMTSWSQVDQFMVCEKPSKADETSFKVSFDPNLEPSYNAIRQGVQRDSLGIIVAAMNTARIWRTKVVSHDVSLGSGSTREFYRAADLPGHKMLVRDVAWAPGSIRGFDICATVCKDGSVRIFEVYTPAKEGREATATENYTKYPSNQAVAPVHRPGEGGAKGGPSGIGAGLATVRSDVSGGNRQGDAKGQVQHTVREVGKLEMHHGPVWRCEFDKDGQLLGTSGDDGRLITWRRKPDGTWAQAGELGLTRSISLQGTHVNGDS